MSGWQRLWMALALTAAVTQASAPGATTTHTATLTDPSQPAELVVRIPYALLKVVGTGRSDVQVEIREKAPGLDAVAIPLVTQGNRVELIHPRNSSLVEIWIEIPRRSDLVLESSNGGLLRVTGVDGSLEIVNSNAGVLLEDVSGAATVSTSNGPIVARFTRVDPGAIISLITSNATIDVWLPESFEGRVLAESDTGPIKSEFLVEPRSAEEAVRRPGRVLSGRIGRGEALLRLRTDNARIQLLRFGG